MIVTLMGPTDMGEWVLSDENGKNFPLVQRYDDHPAAASLFGWKAPESADEEEIIQDALDWLMNHINENIEAPKDLGEWFGGVRDSAATEWKVF